MDELWSGVPTFPQFKDLTLENKPLCDQVFNHFPSQISEFTFTNLFIWRHTYQTRISRYQNFLCLLSEQGENSFFFPPLGEGDVIECCQSILNYLGERVALPRIVRVPEAAATQIGERGSGMKAQLDRSQCDYVYLVQDLIELKGRKYHRKRNHIKQFQANYSYQYISLGLEWIPQCLQLQTEWCDLRNCEANPGLRNESLATKEAFTHFGELEVRGGAILINKKVEAFTFGDPLNPETVVIHVEKANPAYEGLYPAINQAFLEHEWPGYIYVNREQDLGEEGLRKAKESYFPHHLVNKYTITLESRKGG